MKRNRTRMLTHKHKLKDQTHLWLSLWQMQHKNNKKIYQQDSWLSCTILWHLISAMHLYTITVVYIILYYKCCIYWKIISWNSPVGVIINKKLCSVFDQGKTDYNTAVGTYSWYCFPIYSWHFFFFLIHGTMRILVISFQMGFVDRV